jgi:hypothetical protein
MVPKVTTDNRAKNRTNSGHKYLIFYWKIFPNKTKADTIPFEQTNDPFDARFGSSNHLELSSQSIQTVMGSFTARLLHNLYLNKLNKLY